MTWVILEGIDRSGKSTVSKTYESKGYKYIHFSAPDKKYYQPGYTGPSYLDDLIEMLIGLSGQGVVFDRSWYGETIWPYVYGRNPLITDEDIQVLLEIENQNDSIRILMQDPDVEAHWKRCFDNKEPMSRTQFNSAGQMYKTMADKYNFLTKSRDDMIPQEDLKPTVQVPKLVETQADVHSIIKQEQPVKLTPEQLKLQQANAINDVLSGRVVKKKGTEYDAIESRIREFLNGELARLLGTDKAQQLQSLPFSNEEITLLKALASRVKDKRA